MPFKSKLLNYMECLRYLNYELIVDVIIILILLLLLRILSFSSLFIMGRFTKRTIRAISLFIDKILKNVNVTGTNEII